MARVAAPTQRRRADGGQCGQADEGDKGDGLEPGIRHGMHPGDIAMLGAHDRMNSRPIPHVEMKQAKATPERGFWDGAPSGFRTPDPLIKSQLLYQLS